MADMSISGIASGIDWDGMMAKILERSKKPAYVMIEKRDKLELKKGLFEEMKMSLQKLQSAVSPLRRPSIYKAKEISVDRVDSNGSYKGVLTATVNADAKINVHDLEVVKIAKSESWRSKAFSANLSGAFSSGALAGLDKSYFWISAGGKKVKVEVLATDTIDSLAQRANTVLKTQVPPLGVTAFALDNRLVLKSDATGLGKKTLNEVVTRSFNRADTLSTLHIDSETLKNAEIVIRGTGDNASKEWKLGQDFDVVGGNEIRWRQHKPQTVPAGERYTVTYSANAGDTYKVQAVRSSGGATDRDVVKFLPKPGATITITSSGSANYQEGTDFFMDGKNVRWTTSSPPPAGDTYELKYVVPSGGQNFDVNIDRSDGETIAGSGYQEFAGGSSRITYGSLRFKEGVDYDIVKASGSGEAYVRWRPEAAWGAPPVGASYTVTLTREDGTETPFSMTRTATDKVRLSEWGFATATGTIGSNAYYGGETFTAPVFSVTGAGGVFDLTWTQPGGAPVPLANTPPAPGEAYNVEYKYQKNTFVLSDDGKGALAALGLSQTQAAQDAELILDGETLYRSSNAIGPEYENALLEGVTLNLRGPGKVLLDISQDAEAPVKGVQDFVEKYNDLMKWINVRSTEKAVDENKKATLQQDDFRMKWGLLFGNSLLRESKDKMRRIVSQTHSFKFKQRTASAAVYGTMEQNGLRGADTLQISVGARRAEIPILPEDTLESIVAKINNPSNDQGTNPAWELHHDPDGRQYPKPFASAKIEEGKLVIEAGTDREVQLRGSNAMRLLHLDYTYRSMFEVGLKTTAADYGKSGELEFETNKFMEAIRKDPDEVANLMTAFADNMYHFTEDMIRSTATKDDTGYGATKGRVVREISGIDEEVKSINKYLARVEERLQRQKKNLFDKFSAAEKNMAKLMQQASWLASVTAQLQGAGNNNNRQG